MEHVMEFVDGKPNSPQDEQAFCERFYAEMEQWKKHGFRAIIAYLKAKNIPYRLTFDDTDVDKNCICEVPLLFVCPEVADIADDYVFILEPVEDETGGCAVVAAGILPGCQEMTEDDLFCHINVLNLICNNKYMTFCGGGRHEGEFMLIYSVMFPVFETGITDWLLDRLLAALRGDMMLCLAEIVEVFDDNQDDEEP